MGDERVPIPGSELSPRSGERSLPDAPLPQKLTVTMILRRHPSKSAPSEQELLSGAYHSAGRQAAAAALAADPSDLAAVRSFAEGSGLTVVDEDNGARCIRVEGGIPQIEKAFGVHLDWSEDAEGNRYLTYSGAISVPSSLQSIVIAVLGLDGRPVASPRGQ